MFVVAYNKYVPISRAIGNNPNYNKEQFGNATQNWMNFQQGFTPDETFKTTSQISYSEMEGRTDPFALR